MHSPLGDLRSCKAPTIYTSFFVGVSLVFQFLGKQDAPSPVSQEKGKEEKAWDRLQLHLPAADRPCVRLGRSRSVSGLKPYRAEEEQGLQALAMALRHLYLVGRSPGCWSGVAQGAAALLGSSGSRDCAGCVYSLAKGKLCLWDVVLSVEMSKEKVCRYHMAGGSIFPFPPVISAWMLLLVRISCFTSICLYLQGCKEVPRDVGLSQVLVITMTELLGI